MPSAKLIVAFVMVGAAALVYWDASLTRNDEQFAQRLLEKQDEFVRFDAIHGGKWDVVCWIPPYSRVSEIIHEDVPTAPKLRFSPTDAIVDEEQYAFVFVDEGTLQARVFLISNRHIYRIDGKGCARRDGAAFRIETVRALNLTYKNLSVLER